MRQRPFPKKDGKIDKEHVRELYLSGPHYEWTEFCAAHKFNPELRSEFPVKTWGAQWIERKTLEQQVMLAPKALAFRGKLAQGRIDVIGRQMQTNSLLRDLLDKTAQRLGTNVSPAMCPVICEELAILAKTNEILTKTEFQTLLMSARTSAVNTELDAPPMGDRVQDDDDPIPEIEVTTLGQTGMSGKEITGLLASYFDQYEGPRDQIRDSTDAESQDINRPSASSAF